MHIILAVAGAIITILILLRRLGDAGTTIECMQLVACLSDENSSAKNTLIQAFIRYFERLKNR